MTPAARVAAAIEVATRWQDGADGLDRVLAAWGRANRYAGSGDRRAIADLVYDAVRRWRSAGWRAGAEGWPGARAALIGSLLLDGQAPEGVFTGQRHAPDPVDPAEEARWRDSLDGAPWGVRLDLPDWLEPHLSHLPEGHLGLLRTRAPLDLRVNRLRATPEGAYAALAEDGIVAGPGPLAPDCLRVSEGAARLSRSRAYLDGLVEIQDAASQAAAEFAGAAPGAVVLDLCAGGGGKTLALAAAMEGRGRLLAYDIAPQRMAGLPDRAARAGARVELLDARALSRLGPVCDLVVIDAPCSGSGAWRRNPDAKWRLTPGRLDTLVAAQTALIHQAAGYLGPGGRLVYLTCSLLPAENAGPLEALAAAGFDPGSCEKRIFGLDAGADGFFCAKAGLVNTIKN